MNERKGGNKTAHQKPAEAMRWPHHESDYSRPQENHRNLVRSWNLLGAAGDVRKVRQVVGDGNGVGTPTPNVVIWRGVRNESVSAIGRRWTLRLPSAAIAAEKEGHGIGRDWEVHMANSPSVAPFGKSGETSAAADSEPSRPLAVGEPSPCIVGGSMIHSQDCETNTEVKRWSSRTGMLSTNVLLGVNGESNERPFPAFNVVTFPETAPTAPLCVMTIPANALTERAVQNF